MTIRRLYCALLIFIFLTPAAQAASWTTAQAERLAQWLEAAENEALPPMRHRAAQIRAAAERGDRVQRDLVATAAALDLARALRFGATPAEQRRNWRIAGDGDEAALAPMLEGALAADRLDQYFSSLRPIHPYYGLLQRAFVSETDAEKKAIVGINMDRWRWMPRKLGQRYLLVNAATFEVTLWDKGRALRRWPVVVGKPSTPTPVFSATVSGVIFNPWWEIPDSIVEESVGALVRNRPAEARRKGYVIQNGRYRQSPGPNNALGQMKLVMPNSFNVYLHDTPSKSLFSEAVRAFSHGCIRVGGAIDLAATLLAEEPAWPREQIDKILSSRQTVTATLSSTLPVYIAYFTAEPEGAGGTRLPPDLYGRDKTLLANQKMVQEPTVCAA